MSDAEILDWLNHWLVSFAWWPSDRLCHLEYQDPYSHLYVVTGVDLRECVLNAVAKHPTSLTFMQGKTA